MIEFLAGDWQEIDRQCTKTTIAQKPEILYAVYKQQFLENLQRQEHQKGISHCRRSLRRSGWEESEEKGA